MSKGQKDKCSYVETKTVKFMEAEGRKVAAKD
jgi:hypothetical protein